MLVAIKVVTFILSFLIYDAEIKTNHMQIFLSLLLFVGVERNYAV